MKVFAYNPAGEKTIEMSPLDSIKYHHQHMQVGSLSIEPHTGYVRSWVGGVNYKYSIDLEVKSKFFLDSHNCKSAARKSCMKEICAFDLEIDRSTSHQP